MKTITMVELRQDAEKIIQQVSQGQRLVLTYRGRPMVTLEPYREQRVAEEDPFYRLSSLADTKGKSLTNKQIDRTIYGS